MQAILRIDIKDWTTKEANLPPIKKGTPIRVERVKDRTQGFYSDYIAFVRIKGVEYNFEINRKEFDAVN